MSCAPGTVRPRRSGNWRRWALSGSQPTGAAAGADALVSILADEEEEKHQAEVAEDFKPLVERLQKTLEDQVRKCA